MPTIGIITSAPPVPSAEAPRRSTAIVSGAGVTTLTVTSPEVEHTGLGRRWVEIDRPGNLPLLRDAGPKLHKWRLRAILYRDDGGDISAELETIAHGHAAQPSVTIAYGRLEAAEVVITDVTIKIVERVQGTNEPRWAEVELELTTKPPDIRQVTPVVVPSAAPPAPATQVAPASARPTNVTVKAGDTLFAIAQRVYGDGNRWRAIADANKVTDPRKLRVGQVLKLP